ncbi:hypothetical protein ES703_30314 [subsurface metagenome]
MALCSLSTGRICAPLSFTSLVIISPAIINDSLLARATRFPAFTAASVGLSPALPEVAITTVSTCG